MSECKYFSFSFTKVQYLLNLNSSEVSNKSMIVLKIGRYLIENAVYLRLSLILPNNNDVLHICDFWKL